MRLACMHGKWLESCLTLCDHTDSSPPGSSVPGILQAGILEWVAMPSSGGSSQTRDQIHVSSVSCTSSRFFTASATWEPPKNTDYQIKVKFLWTTVMKELKELPQ